MNRRIGKLAAPGVVLALIILAINFWVSYRSIHQLNDRDAWVQHTEAILGQLEGVLADTSDAAAGQRGFLLTGDSEYLKSYDAARLRAQQQVDQVAGLTGDNDRQQKLLPLLREQLNLQFAALDDAIELRKASPAALKRRPDAVQREKEATDNARATIGTMQTEENRLLRQRLAAAQTSLGKAITTFSVATLAAMIMVLLTYGLVRRDEAVRVRSAKEQDRLAAYNRLLIESTSEGIYGVDLSGNCTFLNAAGAKILKTQPEQVIGKHMHDITHHSHPDGTPYPAVECPIYQVIATGRSCRVDNEMFWRADGTGFSVEYSSSVIRSEGKVEGAVVTFSDITARKRTEEDLNRAKEEAEASRAQAEAANVAKSQFLANMSHELRTPLNAVIMYSELLQEEAVDEGVESFIPDLDKIRAAGKHLLALVNGVLDLSKIEAGKMELYLETFEVEALVREVAATVEPLVAKKSNTFELHCTPDVGPMYADVTKVRQILFNLLSNASKFTERGTISLTVDRQEIEGVNWLNFRVADTGIGMTPVQIERLFEPFMQADASTTRRFGGTGLGLAISRRFCEIMGGTISVGSEQAKGSTFVVHLPARVSKPAVVDTRKTPAVPTEPAAAGVTTVLVIDDEPGVRDLMSRSLVSEGLRTVTASDGEEGLQLARQLHPDLIFLDVLMPKMDGWAVLTALKSDARLADIPVVMLTIMNDKDMGYVLGASEYLTKPIDRERLSFVLKKYRTGEPSTCTVLVIEDDDATRQVLRRTLTKQGWTVAEASNGKAALAKLQQQTPALILLDLMMPEMDGFEFITELRKNEALSSIPVVVLTSKDLAPDERARLTGKVERIMQKGAYTRDALLREVRTMVAMCAVKAEPPVSAAPKPVAESDKLTPVVAPEPDQG